MRRSWILAALLAASVPFDSLLAQEGGAPQGGPPGGGFPGGGRGFGDRGGRGRRERDPSTVQLTQFSYQRVEFETKNLTAGKETVGLYLPLDYADPVNADDHYPLIVWLHGMNEDDRSFHFGGAKVVDEMVAAGKLARCIVVAVSAPSRTLYANGERSGNLFDLVTKDVVAWATTNHRVSPERRDHVLMGVSLGGMAALRYGLAAPELFGTVATHSAATFPEELDKLPPQHRGTVERFGESLGWNDLLGSPIEPAKFAAINPTSLARGVKDLKGLRLYFDAGTADRYGFGPANEELSKVLTESKIDHTFRLIEGGEHSWGGGTIQKALEVSLAFVHAGFSENCAANVVVPTPGG
ncbi:MAG: hypothetical protein JNL90_16235 [Planctomycetes bacterium]|nr:hypothetical protein [Planctomycetota bacterium]